MTDIFLGWAGVVGNKHNRGDAIHQSGVRSDRKVQEECEIRLT